MTCVSLRNDLVLEEKNPAVKRPNNSDSEGGNVPSLRTLDLDDSAFLNNSCNTQVWDSNTIQR